MCVHICKHVQTHNATHFYSDYNAGETMLCDHPHIIFKREVGPKIKQAEIKAMHELDVGLLNDFIMLLYAYVVVVIMGYL